MKPLFLLKAELLHSASRFGASGMTADLLLLICRHVLDDPGPVWPVLEADAQIWHVLVPHPANSPGTSTSMTLPLLLLHSFAVYAVLSPVRLQAARAGLVRYMLYLSAAARMSLRAPLGSAEPAAMPALAQSRTVPRKPAKPCSAAALLPAFPPASLDR